MGAAESNEEAKPEVSILMLGLDEAGKTTILRKLFKWQKKLKTIPTIGFNLENIEFEDKIYKIWDIGGCEGVRDLWKVYSEKKSVVIFVVDASDTNRLREAKEFLHEVMSHEKQSNDMLLLVSNKHDKSNCLDEKQLEEQLDLKSLKQIYRIVETSAMNRNSLNSVKIHLRDMHLLR